MLNRRQLIIAAARSSVLLSGAFALAACSKTDQSEAEPAARSAHPGSLEEYAAAMQAISYVGIACRKSLGFGEGQPPETVRVQLERRLLADLPPPGGIEALDEAVDRLVRADFAAGRVIDVEGWKLSETECRLAALAAAAQGFKTAQLPDPPKIRYAHIVEVEAWGPQSTRQGEIFNEQTDGHSGMWFKAAGAPASIVVRFDGRNQATAVFGEHFTSGLRGDFMHNVINTPGVYEVEIFDKASMTRQKVGEFTVHASKNAAAKAPPGVPAVCKIDRWGPKTSKAGQAFNRQPSGASAFWVRSSCSAKGSQLHLGGSPLRTTVRKGLMTAAVPNGHELAAGEHELILVVGGSGEQVQVGTLIVEP